MERELGALTRPRSNSADGSKQDTAATLANAGLALSKATMAGDLASPPAVATHASIAALRRSSLGADDAAAPAPAPLSSAVAGTPGVPPPLPPPPSKPRTYAGLGNQGATCYMNSLLQTLFMTPEFRRTLFSWTYDKEKDGDAEECIPLQLQLLFARLQLSKAGGAVTTTALTRSFGWSGADAFQQHDVQELARVLFDALERSLAGTPNSQLIENLFKGRLADYIKCQDCGIERRRLDDILDLSLVIKPFGATTSVKSVEEALEEYVKSETLEGENAVFCEHCGRRTASTKGMHVAEPPYLLQLQLKRFVFDYVSMNRQKLNDKVTFPFVLDFNRFLAGSSSSGSGAEAAAGASEASTTAAEGEGSNSGSTPESSPAPATADVEAAGSSAGSAVMVPIPEEDEDEETGFGALSAFSSQVVMKFTDEDDESDPNAADEVSMPPLLIPVKKPVVPLLAMDGGGSATAAAAPADASPTSAATAAASTSQSNRQQALALAAANGPHVYELYAVLVHSGSALGGHYYAYIQDLDTGCWYNFNDSSVTPVSVKDVEAAFGGPLASSSSYSSYYSTTYQSAANAYMLMYRKVLPQPYIKVPVSMAAAATAAGGAGAAASGEDGVGAGATPAASGEGAGVDGTSAAPPRPALSPAGTLVFEALQEEGSSGGGACSSDGAAGAEQSPASSSDAASAAPSASSSASTAAFFYMPRSFPSDEEVPLAAREAVEATVAAARIAEEEAAARRTRAKDAVLLKVHRDGVSKTVTVYKTDTVDTAIASIWEALAPLVAVAAGPASSSTGGSDDLDDDTPLSGGGVAALFDDLESDDWPAPAPASSSSTSSASEPLPPPGCVRLREWDPKLKVPKAPVAATTTAGASSNAVPLLLGDASLGISTWKEYALETRPSVDTPWPEWDPTAVTLRLKRLAPPPEDAAAGPGGLPPPWTPLPDVSLTFSYTWTLAKISEAIEAATGVPRARQRLLKVQPSTNTVRIKGSMVLTNPALGLPPMPVEAAEAYHAPEGPGAWEGAVTYSRDAHGALLGDAMRWRTELRVFEEVCELYLYEGPDTSAEAVDAAFDPFSASATAASAAAPAPAPVEAAPAPEPESVPEPEPAPAPAAAISAGQDIALSVLNPLQAAEWPSFMDPSKWEKLPKLADWRDHVRGAGTSSATSTWRDLNSTLDALAYAKPSSAAGSGSGAALLDEEDAALQAALAASLLDSGGGAAPEPAPAPAPLTAADSDVSTDSAAGGSPGATRAQHEALAEVFLSRMRAASEDSASSASGEGSGVSSSSSARATGGGGSSSSGSVQNFRSNPLAGSRRGSKGAASGSEEGASADAAGAAKQLCAPLARSSSFASWDIYNKAKGGALAVSSTSLAAAAAPPVPAPAPSPAAAEVAPLPVATWAGALWTGLAPPTGATAAPAPAPSPSSSFTTHFGSRADPGFTAVAVEDNLLLQAVDRLANEGNVSFTLPGSSDKITLRMDTRMTATALYAAVAAATGLQVGHFLIRRSTSVGPLVKLEDAAAAAAAATPQGTTGYVPPPLVGILRETYSVSSNKDVTLWLTKGRTPREGQRSLQVALHVPATDVVPGTRWAVPPSPPTPLVYAPREDPSGADAELAATAHAWMGGPPLTTEEAAGIAAEAANESSTAAASGGGGAASSAAAPTSPRAAAVFTPLDCILADSSTTVEEVKAGVAPELVTRGLLPDEAPASLARLRVRQRLGQRCERTFADGMKLGDVIASITDWTELAIEVGPPGEVAPRLPPPPPAPAAAAPAPATSSSFFYGFSSFGSTARADAAPMLIYVQWFDRTRWCLGPRREVFLARNETVGAFVARLTASLPGLVEAAAASFEAASGAWATVVPQPHPLPPTPSSVAGSLLDGCGSVTDASSSGAAGAVEPLASPSDSDGASLSCATEDALAAPSPPPLSPAARLAASLCFCALSPYVETPPLKDLPNFSSSSTRWKRVVDHDTTPVTSYTCGFNDGGTVLLCDFDAPLKPLSAAGRAALGLPPLTAEASGSSSESGGSLVTSSGGWTITTMWGGNNSSGSGATGGAGGGAGSGGASSTYKPTAPSWRRKEAGLKIKTKADRDAEKAAAAAAAAAATSPAPAPSPGSSV